MYGKCFHKASQLTFTQRSKCIAKCGMIVLSDRKFAQLKPSEVVLDHEYFSKGIVSTDHAWLCGLTIDHHVNLPNNSIDFKLSLRDYQVLCRIQELVKCNKKISLKIEPDGIVFAILQLYSKQLIGDIMRLLPCDSHNKNRTLPSCLSLLQ
eukprot:543177_1